MNQINIINNYVGHGTKRHNKAFLFLVHVRRHISVRRRTLFIFWQRAFNTQPDLAEKYPSIIVRQTEITLRVVLLWMAGREKGGKRVQYLYLFSFAFHGSVCKYPLNSVIAIFIETRQEED